MTHHEENRWQEARDQVLDRWKEILRRIEARDEGGALALANVIDELCETADEDRAALLKAQAAGRSRLKFYPPTEPIGTRCVFCRAFQEAGGCFVMLSTLNSLIMKERWEEARRVAQAYIDRLASMRLEDPDDPRIH